MNISVIGTGYVGLVTGVCLANKGHNVVCADKNPQIIKKLNDGESTIFEPGLDELLNNAFEQGKLNVTNDLANAIKNSSLSIIAVGTPYINGQIDLSFIENVCYEIGKTIREKDEYHVICVKSTVVPTTTDTFIKRIIEEASGKKAGEFGLAMNPEFLREGNAVEDFMNPDRIIIGAFDDNSFDVVKKVYDGYFETPIIRVNLRTAEMIKYTSNTLLATLISFSNEIAAIGEHIGNIDVGNVLDAVALDRRLNVKYQGENLSAEIVNYLKAGCGFGGSCFPKDLKAIISFSEKIGYEPQILKSTVQINEKQPYRLVNRLEKELISFKGKKIAVLGLAFKPDTDDIRETPAIPIINELINRGAIVYAVDKASIENLKALCPAGCNLHYTTDYKVALKDAYAVIVVTAWDDFKEIKACEFVELMSQPLVFDGRGILDERELNSAGVKYMCVGNINNCDLNQWSSGLKV